MKIKRFFAKDMRTALAQVKDTLGSDAVIMSNKKVSGGIEIVAAIDSEPSVPVKEKQPDKSINKKMEQAHQARRLAEDQVNIYQNKPANSANTSKSSNPSYNNKFSNLLDKFNSSNSEQSNEEDELNDYLAKVQKNKSNTAINRNEKPFATKQQVKSNAVNNLYRQNQKAKSEEKNNLFSNNRSNSASLSTQVNPELENMRKEIESIRGLLEFQLSGLMWQEVERKEPLRALLIKRLQFMGLSPELSDQVAGYIPEDTMPQNAWGEVLQILSDQIITTEDNILELGGVVALLGPTGVGKTTTIAKLAARAAMDYGPDDVALVTTDTFRIGAHEQLATYGRILGCPVKVAKDAEELADILFQLRHRRLVLLDTAGMGQRDLRLSEQLDTLIQNSGAQIRSLLVLSATSQRRVLQETIEHFRRIPLSGCVLTKIDESLSLGEMLSVMIENALPVTFLTNGQRVPEDIRQASSNYLVNRASELMEKDIEQTHFWNHEMPDPNMADFYD